MNKLVSSFLEQIYNTDLVVKKTNVAGAIIFKEQRGQKPALLIIQRAKDDHWPNFWEFPRGGVNDKESILHGLHREVKEETGLDIIPLKFIDKFSYTADKGTRLSTQHNYLCKMKDPNQKIKLSKEHQGFQWITTPGEAELTVLPEMKKSIIKAFEMVDPDIQLVNYPKNDFTPDDIIEESFISPIAILKAGFNDPERKFINKKCGHLKGKEKKKCVSQVKIKLMQNYLSKLPEYRAKCKTQKNPKSCYSVLDKNEKRVKEKIQKYDQNLKENIMDLQEKIKLSEKLVDKYIDESVIAAGLAIAAGGVIGGTLGLYAVKKQCEKLYPDNKEKQEECRKSPMWKRKNLK